MLGHGNDRIKSLLRQPDLLSVDQTICQRFAEQGARWIFRSQAGDSRCISIKTQTNDFIEGKAFSFAEDAVVRRNGKWSDRRTTTEAGVRGHRRQFVEASRTESGVLVGPVRNVGLAQQAGRRIDELDCGSAQRAEQSRERGCLSFQHQLAMIQSDSANPSSTILHSRSLSQLAMELSRRRRWRPQIRFQTLFSRRVFSHRKDRRRIRRVIPCPVECDAVDRGRNIGEGFIIGRERNKTGQHADHYCRWGAGRAGGRGGLDRTWFEMRGPGVATASGWAGEFVSRSDFGFLHRQLPACFARLLHELPAFLRNHGPGGIFSYREDAVFRWTFGKN